MSLSGRMVALLRASLDQHTIRLLVQMGNEAGLMSFDKRLIEGQPVGAVVKFPRGTLTRITDDGWVQWAWTPTPGMQQLRDLHRRLARYLARRASDQTERES